jgi:hypothetical protein
MNSVDSMNSKPGDESMVFKEPFRRGNFSG